MCKIRFWQFCDCGGHIFLQKNANFGRFDAAFDRPEFDRTQQCLLYLVFVYQMHFDRLYNKHLCSIELGSIKCNLETAEIRRKTWQLLS